MLIREGTPNDIEALIALDEVALHDRSRGDYIAQAVKSGGLFVANGTGNQWDTGFWYTPSTETAINWSM